MRIIGGTPHDPITYDVLRYVGDRLGVTLAWYYRGSFHFRLTGDWTLAIKPETPGRLRVETCHLTVPRVTLWTRVEDRARLDQLIEQAREMSLAPA